MDNHQRALQIALSGRNLFATGPAGSGKSFLIERLVRELEAIGRQVALTASTASAAHNLGLGATTLQSRFGFHETATNPVARKSWAEPTTLIVDEISMVGPYLFELMDQLAKRARKCDEPMGGLQVIFVGDFLQLPPVSNKEHPTGAEFIFEMPLWQDLRFQTVVLQTSFRQLDPLFAAILNRIRTGTQSDADVDLLEANVPSRRSNDLTCLYSINKDVDAYNLKQLAKIPAAEEYEWVPQITTEGRPMESKLEKIRKENPPLVLRIGARVMLKANISQADGLVNGARGVFHSVVDDCPAVQFPDGSVRTIPLRRVVHDVIGGKVIVVYMPVVLAWAISIHKSQGQTLDDVFVDCAQMFSEAQVYVALSRASSLAGIQVKGLREALKRKGTVSDKAIKFYQGLK